MWPRKKIDISWLDLAFGATQCLAQVGDERIATNPWEDRDHWMTCLSVRTGFDLLLQALKLPVGSEVVMTAVTIPDMIQIVRHHGLVPVPLDLDSERLCPTNEAIQSCITPSTRAIVLAHLFGTRIPLEPFLIEARKNNVHIIEDCAQAYSGRDTKENPEADASLFSFGPIKTATSLGGALVRVRDKRILQTMRQIHDQYPVQTRRNYAMRLAKYTVLILASRNDVFGLIMWGFRASQRDPDRFINSLARNFNKRDLICSIRHQPSTALLAMLFRRLQTYPPTRVIRRASLGDFLRRSLEKHVCILGGCAEHHSYWAFVVVVNNSDELIRVLRSHGFDATKSHNLTVLDVSSDSPKWLVPQMASTLRNAVFLPFYPELTDEAAARMASIIIEHEQRNSAQKQSITNTTANLLFPFESTVQPLG
jgi:perosamine synthetase